MTPERRRRAVCALTERFGVSERRACAGGRPAPFHPAVSPPATTHRARRSSVDGCARSPRPTPAGAGRWPMRSSSARAGPSTRSAPSVCGATRACAGPSAAPSAAGSVPTRAERHRAQYPNHVWAIDFQFDETADYRRLKMLNIVDEFTREALAMEVDRSITADRLIDVIERLVAVHGAPEHLRMDNGPELLSWALRDWCRFTGTRTIYIEPGSALGEPLRRVLQRPGPRRAAQHRGVRHPHRGPGHCRSLEDGVQHLSTPLVARAGSPPSSSPTDGRRSTQSPAPETITPVLFVASDGNVGAGESTTADAHNGWTKERDPVRKDQERVECRDPHTG